MWGNVIMANGISPYAAHTYKGSANDSKLKILAKFLYQKKLGKS